VTYVDPTGRQAEDAGVKRRYDPSANNPAHRSPEEELLPAGSLESYDPYFALLLFDEKALTALASKLVFPLPPVPPGIDFWKVTRGASMAAVFFSVLLTPAEAGRGSSRTEYEHFLSQAQFQPTASQKYPIAQMPPLAPGMVEPGPAPTPKATDSGLPSILDTAERALVNDDKVLEKQWPYHHIFPKEFKENLLYGGIHPDFWTVQINPRFHRWLHRPESKGGYGWNYKWDAWFFTHPNAEIGEIWDQGIKMMHEIGIEEWMLEHYPNRWIR
jgi:hypothetical protein